MSKLVISCIIFIISSAILVKSSTAAYNVINFGAKADGKTDSTKAFVNAWTAACKSSEPATLYVPKGSFLVKPITFEGQCTNKITFQIDGTIVAPPNYSSLGNTGYWIHFHMVSRLTLSGGTFDATGASYWACRRAGKSCPTPPRSVSFVNCSNVVVSGTTSINSRYFHIAIDQCFNILLQKLKLSAPSTSPNTDGIHVQTSTGITIIGGTIKTGDDCISIGPGSKNLWIERISCGPGHGISIGSLGNYAIEDGVQNVTVVRSVFTGTQNGVRIKTWARASNGFAKKISFRNNIMNNVYNPIIIDQNYCPDKKNCPNQSSGVKISEVTYKNIRGTSATRVAVSFDCSSSNPCTGIKLENIELTYFNKIATSYCKNAKGSTSGVVVPRSCL